MSRRLLITGGAGFIGSNFVRYWHQSQPGPFVVLDTLTYAGNKENLSNIENDPRFRFVKGDICDTVQVSQLLAEEDIDTVVHFAAESHVDRSILGPAVFVQTNFLGTSVLLEAFRQRWEAKGKPPHYRFLHVSTDEVYGSLSMDDPAFTETTPYAPSSPYSATKAGADHMVNAYFRTYGLPTLITNCSNNYGPYQFPEKLIPLMCINMLLGKPLPIFGDGQNVRDWLHVHDHCGALVAVLEKGRPGEVYNIGGQSEMSNVELVHRLCDLMSEAAGERLPVPPRALIEFVCDRPGHDRRYAMDITKIQREIGWSPTYDFATGLRQTVDWYLTHRDWWEPLLSEEYAAYYQALYGSRTIRESNGPS
ncbi:MAG: dTDP-glucose 4,6-dehydratase [Cyanobacteria bacterium J06623_4]